MEITNKYLSIFTKENSLLDTNIEEIRIKKMEEQGLQISVVLSNFRPKSAFSKIELLFKNVIEYSFYHNNNYTFYDVEDFKIFKNNSDCYISFDPDLSIDGISEKDGDFILAKKVYLKMINSIE